MRMFRLWSKDECVQAIKALEEGIASGAQSLSYPAGGSVSYTTLENSHQILTWLYARLDEVEGARGKSAVRFIPTVARRGW